MARALEFAVSGRDVEVATISAPGDILQQAAVFAPDVILLDLGLAGADGLEVCRELKQDSRLASIPVLILSGLTDAATKAASFAAGADDFIAKPFVPTELLARVNARLRPGLAQ